jgi:hypothetical protein
VEQPTAEFTMLAFGSIIQLLIPIFQAQPTAVHFPPGSSQHVLDDELHGRILLPILSQSIDFHIGTSKAAMAAWRASGWQFALIGPGTDCGWMNTQYIGRFA